MRRAVIGIAIFLGVLVAALAIFAATFNINKYRGTIQSELESKLGRRVFLGEMHLSVFPPRFRVENPSIADDPAFSSGTPFIKAQELDVSVKLLPLLHKQVELNSVSLQRPSVNLIKDRQGTWNFASLGHPANNNAPSTNAQPEHPPQPASGKPNPSTGPSAPSPSPASQFSLGKLDITDGTISVLDQQTGEKPSVYDHIDASLKNFSPQHPFTIMVAAHMASSGSQAQLEGEGGPIDNAQPANTPFHGTLSLKQVNTSDLSKFLSSPALTGTEGVITGDTKINNQSGKLSAQGENHIQNVKLHGTDLGFPISVQYDLTDDLNAQLTTIRDLVLQLGSTPLHLNGTVNSKPPTPDIDLNVKANNVSIAEALKLAALSGMALSPGTEASGNLNANLQARGPADKPALNGTVVASNVQLSGKQIAQPVQIPSLNLNLTPSQVQSNPFNVTSAGTTVNTQFTLRNYQSPTPVIDAKLHAPNAQLPAILAMAKAYGVTSLDKISGAGTMNLDMRANGPLKSVNSAEIMRTLNGTVDINFNNVKYSGTNISHELSSIAGFLNPNAASSSSENVTTISTMTGKIAVQNGIAETNNLQAKLDIGNVGVAGTANLVNQALNLRLTAVLQQSVSQKVGGNSIGGYAKTALANNEGQLVIPATVTGTFSNPKFAPDVQQIAQMKLKGLVPDLNNPSALTGTLQNLLGGAKPNNAQNPQAQQPSPQQNAVQQLLGLFGKKKKDQPPK